MRSSGLSGVYVSVAFANKELGFACICIGLPSLAILAESVVIHSGILIASVHREYAARVEEWSRARDVLVGEDAVKVAGVKYLPRLDSQSDEEYGAYKALASFLDATSRTLEEYLDLVFRKAPVPCLDGCADGLLNLRYGLRPVGNGLCARRQPIRIKRGTDCDPE